MQGLEAKEMIHTTTVARCEARFNQVGQRLRDDVVFLNESISPGLASRLHHYAVQRLTEAGFGKAIEGCSVDVCPLDADEVPRYRSYSVRFQNSSKGYIDVIGIFTNHGWPSLDHGFDIGRE